MMHRPAGAVLLLCAILGATAGVFAAKPRRAKQSTQQISNADLPPLVLMGTGRLDCTISSKENGSQILKLTGGAGVHFDVAVTPILDGVIEIKDGKIVSPDAPKGRTLNYRFTSNLASARRFAVTGFAAVKLEQMETKVSVNARRFRQDGGPGTAVTFNSEDMDKQGVYIEFRGIFREVDSDKRFAFRTILGPPSDGSGHVTPLDSNDSSRIVAKSVIVDIQPKPGGPFTQITTTIRELDEK